MLKILDRSVSLDEIREKLATVTIFEKIEFSGISKEDVLKEILYLREVKVPNRGKDVLKDMLDHEVVEYWFKNWLHPKLKHMVMKAPDASRGCSIAVLRRDMERNNLNFHENGQQNYEYTLNDIEEWAKK